MTEANRLHGKTGRVTLVLALALILTAIGAVYSSQQVKAACSQAQATDRGHVTYTATGVIGGSYRAWSRMASDSANAANNSYMLEVTNSAGTTCILIGNAASPALPSTFSGSATDTTNWVGYRDGNTATAATVNLVDGNNDITMWGMEDNVKLDKVIFVGTGGCTQPQGLGTNCEPVVDTTPPTVQLTQPTAGSVLTGTSTLTATASDVGGTVTKVEFYIDSNIIGTADTTSPYNASLVTNSIANGAHNLTAKATDSAGLTTTTGNVAVTINNPVVDTTLPTVSVTAPANNTTVNAGVSVTISANASDNVGVTKVEFSVDGTVVNTDTSSPYSFAWTSTAGSHVLGAKAFDAANNSKSATVNITVNTVTPPPPPPTTCYPEDVNKSGKVDLADFNIVVNLYNKTPLPATVPGTSLPGTRLDFNGTPDGKAGLGEFNRIVLAYNKVSVCP